jgi:hypothetical protein
MMINYHQWWTTDEDNGSVMVTAQAMMLEVVDRCLVDGSRLLRCCHDDGETIYTSTLYLARQQQQLRMNVSSNVS